MSTQKGSDMRARTITTIAALGLAGVLMAPMAHAATSEPPAEVQAAAAQAAAAAAEAAEADAPDAKGHGGGGGWGHHGEGDFFELIGFFDFLHECVSTADWVEDHFDADTVCVPEKGGHHHGFGSSSGHEGGGGEDKDWLLFAAFPHWVHSHHRG
jgi:hypothetical protein